jgi:Protein of unknown function (DUF4231)
MPQQDAYREWLKKDLGGLIEELNLSELQGHSLRSRWLDQVLWMESKAKKSQTMYYIVRLTTIIGGVIVPALVSLRLNGEADTVVGWVVFVISLLVAISAAVEGLFRFGERWRHYRRTAELLKSEGWQFFQLSGPSYERYKSHAEAYSTFAARVEDISRLEVETYITNVAQEKQEKREEKSEDAGSKS